MGAGNLTDEQLLKRAGNAGRNLGVLAILGTLGALAMWAVLLVGRGAAIWSAPLALGFTLLSAGYWVLTVAARRGNPTSVAMVLVIMALQLLFVFGAAGMAAARTNTDVSSNMPGLLVPILVFIALVSSRSVLVELQERGLCEQAFGLVKPSGTLCIVGGALVAIGLALFDGGGMYAGQKIGQARAEEFRGARQFAHILKQEEKDFMSSVGGVLRNGNPAGLDAALAKVNTLEIKVDGLQAETAGASPLSSILQNYRSAVRQWKNALLVLKEPNPDRSRAQQMLALGDKFRNQATQEFQRRFVGPDSKTAS